MQSWNLLGSTNSLPLIPGFGHTITKESSFNNDSSFDYLFTEGPKELGQLFAKAKKKHKITKKLSKLLPKITIHQNGDRCDSERMAYTFNKVLHVFYCPVFFEFTKTMQSLEQDSSRMIKLMFKNILIHEMLHIVGYDHGDDMYDAYNVVVNDLGLNSIIENGEAKLSHYAFQHYKAIYDQIETLRSTANVEKGLNIFGFEHEYFGTKFQFDYCTMIDSYGAIFIGSFVPVVIHKIDYDIDVEKNEIIKKEKRYWSYSATNVTLPEKDELIDIVKRIDINQTYVELPNESNEITFSTENSDGNKIEIEMFRPIDGKNTYIRAVSGENRFLGKCSVSN
jgi:hypothetical protein